MRVNNERAAELERLRDASSPCQWVQIGHEVYFGPVGKSAHVQIPFEPDAASIVAMHNASPDLLADRREMQAENERLREWRASALTVLDQWDRVHETLGSPGPLGGSKALNSLAKIERLRGEVHDCPVCGQACKQCQCTDKEIERLRADLARLVEAAGPFAEFARHTGEFGNPAPIVVDHEHITPGQLSVGDVRRLAAVVAELQAREGR